MIKIKVSVKLIIQYKVYSSITKMGFSIKKVCDNINHRK